MARKIKLDFLSLKIPNLESCVFAAADKHTAVARPADLVYWANVASQ